jgi:hypothetical protein
MAEVVSLKQQQRARAELAAQNNWGLQLVLKRRKALMRSVPIMSDEPTKIDLAMRDEKFIEQIAHGSRRSSVGLKTTEKSRGVAKRRHYSQERCANIRPRHVPSMCPRLAGTSGDETVSHWN